MLNLATHNINSSPALKRYCTSTVASPFGSSLPNRAWSDVSRVYRYGFNGKEKDTKTANDAYDFGARIYDGRLGRWLSLDPLSVLYQELSNYSSFANNPILYIDNQGKTLVIKNGGVSAMYFEGKLYTQGPDGTYTIPYVAGTNTFIDETFTNIELLNATSTGKSTLLRLSDKLAIEYTILDGNTETMTDLKGKIVPKGNAYEKTSNTIYFTNSNLGDIPVEYNIPDDGIESPAFIILGHEMGHALGELDYAFNDVPWFNTEKATGGYRYSMSEIYASHIENMLRSENNLPLRTYYSKDVVYNPIGEIVSTKLLNNKKSIHFKQKTQITIEMYGINENDVWDIVDYKVITIETDEFYDYRKQNTCEKNCD